MQEEAGEHPRRGTPLLNRAPTAHLGSWLVGISGDAAPQLQKAAYQLFARYVSPQVAAPWPPAALYSFSTG
jgi:hypothetical protein